MEKEIESVEEANEFVKEAGYPIYVSSLFTLGQRGNAIIRDKKELTELVRSALDLSPVRQVILRTKPTGQ